MQSWPGLLLDYFAPKVRLGTCNLSLPHYVKAALKVPVHPRRLPNLLSGSTDPDWTWQSQKQAYKYTIIPTLKKQKNVCKNTTSTVLTQPQMSTDTESVPPKTLLEISAQSVLHWIQALLKVLGHMPLHAWTLWNQPALCS